MRWVLGALLVLAMVAGGFAVGIGVGEEDGAAPAATSTTTTTTTVPSGPGDERAPSGWADVHVIGVSEGTYDGAQLRLQADDAMLSVNAGDVTALDTRVEQARQGALLVPDGDDRATMTAFRLSGGRAEGGMVVLDAEVLERIPVALQGVDGLRDPRHGTSDEPPARFGDAWLVVLAPLASG